MSEPVVIGGLTLHPELQFLLQIRAQRNDPPLSTMSPDTIRANTLRDSITAGGEPTTVHSVTDLTVDGATGPLRARLYTPGPEWTSLLVFFHGGGFVFGDVDSHDGPCRLLTAAGGFAVLSVEYRLAPENRHPAAVEDAWAAWQWTLANLATLGADPSTRLAIGGDSAGGLLAAVVCQLAVRSGVRAPDLQVLIYAAMSREPDVQSMQLFADGFFLTRAEIDFFEACLFTDVVDDPADYRRRPITGELAGLPPALVVTAGFDPLRDGGEAYAAALQAAGTPAVMRRYDSMIHGFISMIGFSPAAKAATVEIAETIAALLQSSPSPVVAQTGG